MAFERLSDNKIKGDGLDVFVDNRLKMFSRQVSIRNAEDELHFNTAVLEQNLSLEDQLNYRKEQLKRVADSPDERRRIRAEIASLNDRVEQKKYSDEYTSKLIDFESGVSSIDSMIGWLNDRLSNTTDQNIRDSINKTLIDFNSRRFELQKQVLQNQTNYALKDKSDTVMDNQIGRVTSLKNQALLSGNTDLISIYDLQLQALNQAKVANSIEKDVKNFSVATMVGASKATDLLDVYNNKINTAAKDNPVTIGGVTYDSAQEFWRIKRDSYIADDSGNGFFSRVSDESKSALKTLYSSNVLTNDAVSSAANMLSALSSRPELQPFLYKVNQTKQDVLQVGSDLRSNTIVAQYSVDSDVNKAVTNLTALKGLGVNVDAPMSKIINAAADVKSQQVQAIQQRVGQLVDTGVDPQKAIDQAVREGASIYLSPEQYATTTPEAIVKDTTKAATTKTGGNPDARTTIQDPGAVSSSIPPTVPQAPAPGAAPTNSSGSAAGTYKVVAGDTLSAISQKLLGSAGRYNEIAQLNGISNPNVITPGMVLKLPGANATPAPTSAPTPATPKAVTPSTPAPAPQPTAVPSAPQPAAQVTYKVAAGDTLSAIAQKLLGNASRYGDIAKINNIKDPNKIAVGQQLVIPK